MTTRRHAFLSLLLAGAALPTATLRAQTAGDSTCSYSQCALRVEHDVWSGRLVRGAAGEPVGRLGWFGSGVGVLLAGSDSAAHYARQYQSRRRTLDVLGLTSAALLLLTVATTEDFANSSTLAAGAITLQLISLPFGLRSRTSLERSVWWYNRELPRP